MIYFDNAATSFPKPVQVYDEVNRCMREYCGNPGRGSHILSRLASEKIFETRELLASFFGASGPQNVVFTLNTSYALNTVIKAAAPDGCHVLISDTEHNSVLRPVAALSSKGKISYSVFRTVGLSDDKIIENIKLQIRNRTRMLICRHASNVCGNVLPVEKIGKLCKERGIFFVVDAAQSAGKYKIDVRESCINALCLPSHKGLYGPQGGGAIVFENVNVRSLDTFAEGGSGSSSKDLFMPRELPDRFEAGTLPTPVIAGLCEGVRFVMKNGVRAIREYEEELWQLLCDNLREDGRFVVYAPEFKGTVLSFNVKSKSSIEVASELDRRGICARAGFHCAPMVHAAYNTGDDGAVRVSFGVYNDRNQVIKLLDCLNAVASDR